MLAGETDISAHTLERHVPRGARGDVAGENAVARVDQRTMRSRLALLAALWSGVVLLGAAVAFAAIRS
jgi:hypothetical protein